MSFNDGFLSRKSGNTGPSLVLVSCKKAKANFRLVFSWAEIIIPAGHESGSGLKLMRTWSIFQGTLGGFSLCRDATRLFHTLMIMKGLILKESAYLRMSRLLVVQDLLHESRAPG